MAGFEEFEQLERLNEQLEPKTEGISESIVSGFENVSDMSNQQIIDYINEVIPPEHLADCSKIEYSPNNKIFKDYPNALGIYDVIKREIFIAGEERFENKDLLYDTVVHEAGHSAYSYIGKDNPQALQVWDSIYNTSLVTYEKTGMGFVSAYAMQNKFEDFAESYMTYVRDPELLQFVNEQKYNFMKYNVFNGKDLMNDVITVGRELPSSHLDGMFELREGLNGINGKDYQILITKSELVYQVGNHLYDSYIAKTPGLRNSFETVGMDSGNTAFAKAYGEYVLDPDDFKNNNASLYNFMRDKVFLGKEYTNNDDGLVHHQKMSADQYVSNEDMRFSCKGVTIDLIARSKDTNDGTPTIKLCETLDYYASVKNDQEGILFSSSMGYKRPNTCSFEANDRIEMRCD